jgi:alkylation response protein AidB-like acyl-CoA dehydrogenase
MRRDLFEPEHEEYRRSIRAFLVREVVPHYAAWEREGIVPRSLFTSLGALGAFGFDAPEKHGGSEMHDLRFSAILVEEACGLAVYPAVVGPALQADVVIPYLVGLTTEEQQDRWLPGVVGGTTITAIAMTEPDTGSDLAGISTRAVRDGDHYVINGSKTFITNGINADLVIVAARTGADPHRGLSLFVVERGMAGFERGRRLEKIGLHAQDTAELTFDDVRVPAANRLGEEGDGFAGLTRNLARERLSVAIGAMAMTRWAISVTAEHVRGRRAFGQALTDLQTVRHRLAELDTEADLGTLFVDRCIRDHNAGALSPVDAAKAKWWTTELQGRALDAGVQLHGGYGYMQEYPITRAWTDARVSRIYGGTTEIMKEIIGRNLLAAR